MITKALFVEGIDRFHPPKWTHVARVTTRKMRPDDLDDEHLSDALTAKDASIGRFRVDGQLQMVPLPNVLR